MKAGFAFRMDVEGVNVGVVFTTHFVERYEHGDRNRAPAKTAISEEKVLASVQEAIPVIVDWFSAGIKEIHGVIRSRSTKVNLSFDVNRKSNGFTVVVKNAMVKGDYVLSKVNDYLITVNPPYYVHFVPKLDRDLKVAVLDHLVSVVETIEPDSCVSLETPEASYVADRVENDIYIEEAGWLEDMVAVDVR